MKMKYVEIIDKEINKMKVLLIKPRSGVYAEGIYDDNTGHIIVKKGSKVSADVRSYKTRSADPILEERNKVVVDNILMEDIEFKSASGAAVFVTGRSTNGLVAWKDEKGRNINQIMGKDDFI